MIARYGWLWKNSSNSFRMSFSNPFLIGIRGLRIVSEFNWQAFVTELIVDLSSFISTPTWNRMAFIVET